jgi:CBS domain-containing protein
MRPLNKLLAVPPDMPAVKALELMGRENVQELPVMAEGKLAGIFSRSQLFRFIKVYAGQPADRNDRAA